MDAKFMKHGMFGWFELGTTDVEAAKRFYTALFDWKTEAMDMPGMSYTIVKAGGEEVAGMMTLPPQAKGVPPYWGIYVSVDDVDLTTKKAQDLGGAVLVAPTDIPTVGRFAVLKDPQGAVISVITYLKK